MPTRLLYQEDSYLKEFEATVMRVEDGSKVVLDQTAFHPGPHGGLDTDTGYLEVNGARYRVVRAEMVGGEVVHHMDNSFPASPGDKVSGYIDWERRYRMMRLHTFSHILAAVLYEKHGVLVSGGHIGPDYAKDDFTVESPSWRDIIEEAFRESLEIASRCIEVRVYWLPREKALQIPGVVKLQGRLPPDMDTLRIVEIPDVDIQADGGPHVRNTCEIGGVVITKLESKGRRRKRVYYALEDSFKEEGG